MLREHSNAEDSSFDFKYVKPSDWCVTACDCHASAVQMHNSTLGDIHSDSHLWTCRGAGQLQWTAPAVTYPAASLQWMSLHAPPAPPAPPVTSPLQQRGCVSLVLTSIYTGAKLYLTGTSDLFGENRRPCYVAAVCRLLMSLPNGGTNLYILKLESDVSHLQQTQPCYHLASHLARLCNYPSCGFTVPAAHERTWEILPPAYTTMQCARVLLGQAGRCTPAGQRTMALN